MIKLTKTMELIEEIFEIIQSPKEKDNDEERVVIEDLNRRLKQLHMAQFGYMRKDKTGNLYEKKEK